MQASINELLVDRGLTLLDDFVEVSNWLRSQVRTVGKLTSQLLLFFSLVLEFQSFFPLFFLVPVQGRFLTFRNHFVEFKVTTFHCQTFLAAELVVDLELQVIIELHVSLFRVFKQPWSFLITSLFSMGVFFKLLGRPDNFPQHLKLSVLHIEHLNIVSWFFKDFTDRLKVLFVFGSEQVQGLAWFSDTSGTPTPVNIDLSVEGALVVDNIVYVGDVETSRSDISANQDNAVMIGVSSRWAKFDGLPFDLLNTRSEPIKIL